jgi:hypothetical protein
MATVLKPYKSYNFRDKDPVIDRLRTIVADEGASYLQIHEASGVSLSTMYNWFSGPTRRPTHAAVAAVAGALGYDFTLVRHGKASNVVRLARKRAHA